MLRPTIATPRNVRTIGIEIDGLQGFEFDMSDDRVGLIADNHFIQNQVSSGSGFRIPPIVRVPEAYVLGTGGQGHGPRIRLSILPGVRLDHSGRLNISEIGDTFLSIPTE